MTIPFTSLVVYWVRRDRIRRCTRKTRGSFVHSSCSEGPIGSCSRPLVYSGSNSKIGQRLQQNTLVSTLLNGFRIPDRMKRWFCWSRRAKKYGMATRRDAYELNPGDAPTPKYLLLFLWVGTTRPESKERKAAAFS